MEGETLRKIKIFKKICEAMDSVLLIKAFEDAFEKVEIERKKDIARKVIGSKELYEAVLNLATIYKVIKTNKLQEQVEHLGKDRNLFPVLNYNIRAHKL